MPYIFIGLLLFTCVVLILYYNKKIKNIIKTIEIRETIKDLEGRIEDRQKVLQDLKERESSLREQNKFINLDLQEAEQRIINANKTIDTLIEDGRSIAQKQINNEILLLKQQLIARAQEEHQAYLATLFQEKKELEELIAPLKIELIEYQSKREGIINALQRERELENEKDFHRICLSITSIEDINYVKTILDKLNNKAVVAKVVYEAYIQSPMNEMLKRIIGKDKKSGIYRITNLRTQECYIGQATDLKTRLTQHCRGSLGIQTIADQKIHHEMAKEGIENWTFEVLEECEKANLSSREKYWIQFYQSNIFGYNKTSGG